MKKLFLISLMLMLFAGMVFSIDSASQPPGEIALEMNLIGYNANSGIVAQPAVLENVSVFLAEVSDLQVVLVQIDRIIARQPIDGSVISKLLIRHEQGLTCSASDFYLRC